MIRKLSALILFALACAATAVAQTAYAYDLKIEHNAPSDNGPMLKVNFKMRVQGVKGHQIIPVLFIDTKRGTGHKFADGSPMKQDGTTRTAIYDDTYWASGDDWVGIYNRALNPLPGNPDYNLRILIWDCDLKRYIGDLSNTEWITFKMNK